MASNIENGLNFGRLIRDSARMAQALGATAVFDRQNQVVDIHNEKWNYVLMRKTPSRITVEVRNLGIDKGGVIDNPSKLSIDLDQSSVTFSDEQGKTLRFDRDGKVVIMGSEVKSNEEK